MWKKKGGSKRKKKKVKIEKQNKKELGQRRNIPWTTRIHGQVLKETTLVGYCEEISAGKPETNEKQREAKGEKKKSWPSTGFWCSPDTLSVGSAPFPCSWSSEVWDSSCSEDTEASHSVQFFWLKYSGLIHSFSFFSSFPSALTVVDSHFNLQLDSLQSQGGSEGLWPTTSTDGSSGCFSSASATTGFPALWMRCNRSLNRDNRLIRRDSEVDSSTIATRHKNKKFRMVTTLVSFLRFLGRFVVW